MRKAGIVVAITALASLLLWLIWPPKPPDLAGCIRVEIQYEGGALDRLLPGSDFQEHLLDQQERDYVRSYDRWTLTDHEQIDALACYVNKGTYAGVSRGYVEGYGMHVTCYREGGALTDFTMHKRNVIDDRQKVFAYSLDLMTCPAIEPPGIRTLKSRWDCASNLALLNTERTLRLRPPQLPALDPNRWCDDLAEVFRLHGCSEDHIAEVLTCPSVHSAADANGARGKPFDASLPSQPSSRVRTSDYAMNPYFESNSRGDAVFLFEAKPGWNQHGGPELFTFDNHDPKGGCVLLNDGTVRFIRASEELAQLRWKP
jgi:hypothetical protein